MAPLEKVTHRVTIFTHAGKTIVWPPYLPVEAGDDVVFSTIGTAATITLPYFYAFAAAQDNVLEAPGDGQEAIIRVGKDSAVRVSTQADLSKVNLDTLRAIMPGAVSKNTQCYAYSVYCGEVNDLGQGQSSPVMFIEPPEKPGGG
jgi:hypothetical protein